MNILSHKNKVLLRELIITDFKLRYQGSALGYAWSLLKPLMLFAILYTVFGIFMRAGDGIPHFPVYLLLGIVLWSFFSEATSQGLQSIVARGDLIRKINFPKSIIVISGTTSALINLFFNLVVVAFFVLVNNVELTPKILLLPVVIMEIYILALAVAFFLAALNVKFRDVGYLWDIVLQAAFYATPILYSVSLVTDKSLLVGQIILLNPMAQAIQDARYLVVSDRTLTLWSIVNDWRIAVPFILVGILLLCAAIYFRKVSKCFAEYV